MNKRRLWGSGQLVPSIQRWVERDSITGGIVIIIDLLRTIWTAGSSLLTSKRCAVDRSVLTTACRQYSAVLIDDNGQAVWLKLHRHAVRRQQDADEMWRIPSCQ